MKMTGLHWAAARGYEDIIKLLLRYGAYINSLDANHRTPLHLAARFNHLGCVRILVENKADPLVFTEGKKLPVKLTQNTTIELLLKNYMKDIYVNKFKSRLK